MNRTLCNWEYIFTMRLLLTHFLYTFLASIITKKWLFKVFVLSKMSLGMHAQLLQLGTQLSRVFFQVGFSYSKSGLCLISFSAKYRLLETAKILPKHIISHFEGMLEGSLSTDSVWLCNKSFYNPLSISKKSQ